jgi:alpha-ribazole phosphatase/probable phosphoglycerate mutase
LVRTEHVGLVDLLRHGEPVGGRRYRGQIDDPLSEKGWAQMWAAVGSSPPWTRVVTSPLQRCSAFAHALAERHGLPIVEEPRFKEVRFGVWEGRTHEELDRNEAGVLARFHHDPLSNRPEGAEPLEDFFERVTTAWDAWTGSHIQEHTLLVTHAGVIRAVMAYVLGIPLSHMYRVAVTNAGLTRIRLTSSRPASLIFHSGQVDFRGG